MISIGEEEAESWWMKSGNLQQQLGIRKASASIWQHTAKT